MIDFYIQLIVVVLVITVGLCTAIWRLAKAGGHVILSGTIDVGWGDKK